MHTIAEPRSGQLKNSIRHVLTLAALAVLATGCVSTFKEVKPLSSGPPPKQRPGELAVGEIKIADIRLAESEQKIMRQAFQLGVESWCARHNAFKCVEVSAVTGAPDRGIIVTGVIREVEKGSAAARFWVGMGAGQARVQGEFTVNAGDGAVLLQFHARQSYLGGTGIGGWDMLKLEELVTKLGEVVAETTDKWLRGQKLK